MKHDAFHLAPAVLLRSWRQRLSHLTLRLSQSPEAEDAWFWRVQSRVIGYLLHRYGTATATLIEDTIVTEIDPPSPRPLPFVASHLLIESVANPPRGSSKLGAIARQITSANQQRYNDLGRQREEEAAMRRRDAEMFSADFQWWMTHVGTHTSLADVAVDELERNFRAWVADRRFSKHVEPTADSKSTGDPNQQRHTPR